VIPSNPAVPPQPDLHNHPRPALEATPSCSWLGASIDLREVDSTNAFIRRLLEGDHQGLWPLPVAVWTGRQRAGKGRGTNFWWSDAGTLTFTVALDPAAQRLRLDHLPRLALACAVAIVDVVEPLAPQARWTIRWPNDVEANNLKVAGILPERFATPCGDRLALGVGLNVSTNWNHAPESVRRMAASVESIRGTVLADQERRDLASRLLERLVARLTQLADDHPDLAERWDQLDQLKGNRVRIRQGERVLEGVGGGIDPTGALRLLTADGSIQSIVGGVVERNPPHG